MTRRLLLLGAALCTAVVLPAQPGSCSGAECPSAVQKVYPEKGPAEEKIEKALDSPTAMEFVETPMLEIIEFLKKLHAIEIQIDRRALDDVGVGVDTPITRNLKGISLRSALQLILRDMELTYLVKDEVLLITTREMVENSSLMMTKVYPVGDLLGLYDGGSGVAGDFGLLIKTITTSICPDSWEDMGGPGSVSVAPFEGVDALVVMQTYEIHRQVTALLMNLRKAASDNCQAAAAQPSTADTGPQTCHGGRRCLARLRRCR